MNKGARHIKVVCNSGALRAEFIGVLGNQIYHNTAKVGDVIKVVIKEALPTSIKVKDGHVVDALVVTTTAPYKDEFSNVIRFNEIRVVLLKRDVKKTLIPIGSRINSDISRGAMKEDGPVAVNRAAVNKLLSTARGVY